MKVITLQYHDVINPGEFAGSGFPRPSSAKYKLECQEFERHLGALRHALPADPVTVLDIHALPPDSKPFMLTFDDGGVSAYTCIIDALDRYGWKGHFFIPTNYIGLPTFLHKEHIRAMRHRGHVIGSHSCSHPERMAHQSWADMMREWTTSINCLSDILGEEVSTASVPNGYFSKKVAEAASLSGVKALFTSEPVWRSHTVGGCMVFGRYVILRGTDPKLSAAVALGRRAPRCQQFLVWNLKKAVKALGGNAYLELRSLMIKWAK